MATVITQELIDALKLAIVSGTLEVEYADKRIKYRSISEMRQALEFAENEIRGPRRMRVDYSSFKKDTQ